MGLFSRKKKLDEGLAKTRKGFFAGILDMLNAGEIDDHMYEDLEEQLILADTGADEAVRLVDENSAAEMGKITGGLNIPGMNL